MALDNVDYIIIGQGLAGSLLSWELIQAGKEVVVIDNGAESASRVAAGLFNPVTGRRMSESWRVKELLPVAENTYRRLEEELDSSFYHPVPMVRLFPTPEERDANLKRMEGFPEDNYIGQLFNEFQTKGLKPISSGACEVRGTGYVDTEAFLLAYRDWLRSLGRLTEKELRNEDLKLSDSEVSWHDVKCKVIVFCEGYRGAQNPWFAYLPWNLCKGEVLTIHAPELESDSILSRGIYIVPLGNDLFRVGATYSWDQLDNAVTTEARQTLTNALDQILDVPYKVIDQKAGVRPTVKHRRPMLGRHPEYPQLSIFNGLGTKGVLLAPFFARQMAVYLEGNAALDKEVDIAQFSN